MLPTIYLIRHGLTVTNAAGICCGASETDLLPEGVQQAAQAGEFFSGVGIKQAFVSSLRRTRQTYDALCLPGSIPVEYDKRLWEINLGSYEMKTEAQFAAEVSLSKFREDHNFTVAGCESINDMKARLNEFLSEKVAGIDGPVLIVSHGMTTRVLLMMLTAGDEDKMARVEVLNCEVWKVEAGDCQKVFVPAAPLS